MSIRLKLAFSKPFLPFWLLMLVITLLAKDHIFFWDTIQLGSKHAHWYYENAFQHFLLPPDIDSGHIPTFGMYIALCWLLFGKSLFVSHLAMLPFLLGTVYYYYRIGKLIVEEKKLTFLLLLLIADPVFVGQAILVSPDIALLCFFLMAVFGIMSQKNSLKWIGLTALPLVSMRGMMIVFGLFLFEVLRGEGRGVRKFWEHCLELVKTGFRKVPWYIPGGMISLIFLFYHYQQTGWIGYHPDSPWALSYERVGLKGTIKNIGILGWRLLDYGRIFLWLGLALGAILFLKQKRKWDRKYVDIPLLFGILLAVLSIPMLTHKAILAHRYLLPIFLIFSLLFFQLWHSILADQKKWIGVVFSIAFMGLLSGNLWVYPKKIAQGWDSTLAHWPHYQVRAEMIDFIKKEGISFQIIGTAFPEIGPFKFKDLSKVEDGFSSKDLAQQPYILYANTMNDFTDEEIDTLEAQWEVVHEIRRGGVCFILYQGSGIRDQ